MATIPPKVNKKKNPAMHNESNEYMQHRVSVTFFLGSNCLLRAPGDTESCLRWCSYLGVAHTSVESVTPVLRKAALAKLKALESGRRGLAGVGGGDKRAWEESLTRLRYYTCMKLSSNTFICSSLSSVNTPVADAETEVA